jgi:hypothetical protein
MGLLRRVRALERTLSFARLDHANVYLAPDDERTLRETEKHMKEAQEMANALEDD